MRAKRHPRSDRYPSTASRSPGRRPRLTCRALRRSRSDKCGRGLSGLPERPAPRSSAARSSSTPASEYQRKSGVSKQRRNVVSPWIYAADHALSTRRTDAASGCWCGSWCPAQEGDAARSTSVREMRVIRTTCSPRYESGKHIAASRAATAVTAHLLLAARYARCLGRRLSVLPRSDRSGCLGRYARSTDRAPDVISRDSHRATRHVMGTVVGLAV